MNKQKLASSIILLFSLFLMVSCTNEPVDPAVATQLAAANAAASNGGGGTTGTYYVKAQVDGVQNNWSTAIQAQYSTTLHALMILSSDGTTSMSLHIMQSTDVTATNYPLVWTNVGCSQNIGADIFSSDYSDFSTSAGSITLTQFDLTNKIAKGTFNFVGKNNAMTATKTYTSGEFNVTFTVQ